jgi:hypothetical protein
MLTRLAVGFLILFSLLLNSAGANAQTPPIPPQQEAVIRTVLGILIDNGSIVVPSDLTRAQAIDAMVGALKVAGVNQDATKLFENMLIGIATDLVAARNNITTVQTEATNLKADVVALQAGVAALEGSQGRTWSGMPSPLTEFQGATATRTRIDLSPTYKSVRLTANLITPGAAGSVLWVQYSGDGATWTDLITGRLSLATAGVFATPWEVIPPAAAKDVIVRVVGSGGDGTASPSFGLVTIDVK